MRRLRSLILSVDRATSSNESLASAISGVSSFNTSAATASGSSSKRRSSASRLGRPTGLTSTRQGEARWVELSLSQQAVQGIATTLCILVDITDRKRAEEALRRVHTDLEAQVENRTAELQQANHRGLGRELFAGFRRNALSAEEGACTWLL